MLRIKNTCGKAGGGKYNAPALRSGLEIIRILSGASSPMRLSDLSRAIGSNKNTTTRLLATLQSEGWVELELPGPQYRLTLLPFSITSRAVNRLTLGQAARLPMQALWQDTGESIYLAIRLNHQVLYLEHLAATGPVKLAGQAGGQYPLHCSAPGKVLLAFAGEAVVQEIVTAGLKRYTETTLTDAKRLRAELARVRSQDFAMDNEEYGRGLICYAAPIRDSSGEVIGTIGASATTIFYDLPAFKHQVGMKISRTASDISKLLGYDGQSITTGAPGLGKGTI